MSSKEDAWNEGFKRALREHDARVDDTDAIDGNPYREAGKTGETG